jgi:hypothetical protein
VDLDRGVDVGRSGIDGVLLGDHLVGLELA